MIVHAAGKSNWLATAESLLPRNPFLALMAMLTLLVPSSRADSQVTLAWDASPDSTVVGYRLYQGGQSQVYTNVIDAGDVTSNTVPGLQAGGTYYFAATAYDATGLESVFSQEVAYTVPSTSPPVQVLPAPWQGADIGRVGGAGSETVSNEVFSVQGAGSIGGTADSFHFVYQPLSADGELTACIEGVPSGPKGCAGVMIRESLSSPARFAFMSFYGNDTFRWQDRSGTGGFTLLTKSSSGTPPQTWVRVVRAGDILYGYRSTDGQNWDLVTWQSVVMASDIYIGLAVASGSTSQLGTGRFSHLSVVP